MKIRLGCLFLGLVLPSVAVYAADNQLFQNLDNQIGVGYNFMSYHAYNPQNSSVAVTTNSNNFNVHLEDLFDNNVWFAANGNFAFHANQNQPGGVGFSQNTQEFGFPANVALKGGYSFNWSQIGFQVIPYATAGRYLNYNGMSIVQNGFANSYLNMYGAGVRLEYVFVPSASVYFDQGVSYLQDPNGGYPNQSGMMYSSELGIKYNVSQYFQIGLAGMFNQINVTDPSIGFDPMSLYTQNTAQSSYGVLLNFAYLFDNHAIGGLGRDDEVDTRSNLAKFDNSYSVGFGMLSTNNNYAAGSQAGINSQATYFNFDVTHLFDNHVWANINAQLLNSINQTNVPTGTINSKVPTYLGFPGNAVANVGYGFQVADSGFQVIPYADAGVVMNINSYNVRSNSSFIDAISQDMYLQYGAGGRVEYAINDFWQIYADQLLAERDDRSALNINAWRSTSTVGVNIHPWSQLQLGLKGFYDVINPTGSSSVGSNTIAAEQNGLGMEFDIGLRY